MAAVILNGSNNDDILSLTMARCLQKMLSAYYYRVSSYLLAQEPIDNCVRCFDCWLKYPGECQIADKCKDISIKIANSSLVVAITPVTLGGYSAELKKIIDRQLPTLLPFYDKTNGETHYMKRYSTNPTWLVIGIVYRRNEVREQLFHRLVARNRLTIFNENSIAKILSRDASAYEIQSFLKTALSSVGVI